MRIGIVAGEVSGDLLGAGLLAALKRRGVELECVGIGGPRMIAEGCRSLFPMERLSIMGFDEAFARVREILAIRRELREHFLRQPPHVFVGIDAPDFNLELESRLRGAGVRTVHYVSPTVWAWRRYRLRKIRKAVDCMLTLFPFESEFYRRAGVPVTFVGHPMADEITDTTDPQEYSGRLGLPLDATIVALLPGSREAELKAHADLFVRSAQWLARRRPLHFVVPFVNERTRALFERALERNGARGLSLTPLAGRSREAMAAADAVLLASGTAALEAALLARPMVVTYKVSLLSQLLIRLFSHVKLYSMPNHLAGRALVPELMQRDAVPEKLGAAVEGFLANPTKAEEIRRACRDIHAQLKTGANERAADAVLALAGFGA